MIYVYYLNGQEASEHLVDNQGLNPIGVIPFVYGKRQKSKLIPTQDTDMLAIAKAIPVQISDLGMAMMYQCFSIIFGEATSEGLYKREHHPSDHPYTNVSADHGCEEGGSYHGEGQSGAATDREERVV